MKSFLVALIALLLISPTEAGTYSRGRGSKFSDWLKKNTKSPTELRKEFRQSKFNEATKNGSSIFFAVNEGPLEAEVRLDFDSFTEKYTCGINYDLGSFEVDENNNDLFLTLTRCNGIFGCVGSEFPYVEYRKDGGEINSLAINVFFGPTVYIYDRYAYARIPWTLIKDSEEVVFRYGAAGDKKKVTTLFKPKLLKALFDYYQLCLNSKYVPLR